MVEYHHDIHVHCIYHYTIRKQLSVRACVRVCVCGLSYDTRSYSTLEKKSRLSLQRCT